MKQYILKNLRHPLAANFLKIFSGNALIQVISFLTLPVFARIYVPADYGVWGIFVFLSGLLAVGACLRYELAIMIPVSDHEAKLLLRISKTLNLLLMAILFIPIVVFSGPVCSLFNLNTDWKFTLLIPVHAYFTAYNSLMFQWISRKRKFSLITIIRFFQGLINIIVSFIAGYYFNLQAWGLILANVVSVLLSNIIIDSLMKTSFYSGFVFKRSVINKYIGKYNNFVYYSTPLAVLNYSTANILSYIMQTGFGSVVTGLYTNAMRLVNTPLSLISSSFSAVFYQYFSRSENKTKVLTGSLVILLLIFTSLLLPLVIWGEPLIVWYLGENWRGSAVFIQILASLAVMSFSVSSVSTIFSFMQKERIVLIWQVIYLIVVISVFTFNRSNLTAGLWAYSITGTFAYLILFIAGYYLVKQHEIRHKA